MTGPEPASSYSDPIYDRLERVSQGMAKRWKLLLVLFLLALGIGIYLQTLAERSPEAASASAYASALGDREALEALVEDEEQTAEVRAGAAHEVAKLALQDDRLTDAEQAIERAADLAAETENHALRLGIGLTTGAIAEARGDWAAAIDAYRSVEDRAVGQQVQDVDARLRRALALLAWSRAEEGEQSSQRREEGLMLLDALASGSDVPAFVRNVASMAAADARLGAPEATTTEDDAGSAAAGDSAEDTTSAAEE